MEQRIASLEEEVKLLKNQIHAVLLEIKESLVSGDWQVPVKGVEEEAAESLEEEAEGREAGGEKSSVEVEGEAGEGGIRTAGQPVDSFPAAFRGGKEVEGGLEALKLVLLLEWLERSRRELGEEETERLVEVYRRGGGVSEEVGEVLELLVKMGQGQRAGAVSLLLELDGLVRGTAESRLVRAVALELLRGEHSRRNGRPQDN